MTLYCWNVENQAFNNQDNWDKIQFWWENLNNCNVKRCCMSGTFTKSENLTIYNPSLKDNCLEYNSDQKILFKKLELNTSNNTLEVRLSNNSQVYTFTLNT
jgi:hypothetical protein